MHANSPMVPQRPVRRLSHPGEYVSKGTQRWGDEKNVTQNMRR